MDSSRFTSPSDVYEHINRTIDKLRTKNIDPTPLEQVQATAYTTSSEWLGELGEAIRKIEKAGISDPDLVRS